MEVLVKKKNEEINLLSQPNFELQLSGSEDKMSIKN